MNRKRAFITVTHRIAFAIMLTCLSDGATAGSSQVDIQMTGTVTGGGSCSVNNDEVVDISFGDVPIEEIDGVSAYAQPVPLMVSCPGSVTPDTTLTVHIVVANTQSWDNQSIMTSVDGLGIRFWDFIPSIIIQPVSSENMTGGFTNKPSQINSNQINAVLTKAPGATLTPQDFTATATLEVTYN